MKLRDAARRIVIIASKIALVLGVGNQTSATVAFNVVERLDTNIILGYEFYDFHFGGIPHNFESWS